MTYYAYMKIQTVYLKVHNKYFPLKPDSVGAPDIYLGTKLKLMLLENGVWALGISASKYVREAVKNCKDLVSKHLLPQYRLPKLAPNPFLTNYEVWTGNRHQSRTWARPSIIFPVSDWNHLLDDWVRKHTQSNRSLIAIFSLCISEWRPLGCNFANHGLPRHTP